MAFEFPVAEVFYPPCFAIIVTELGHSQVIIAITVQIATTHIGYAGHFIDNYVLGKIELPVIFQHYYRANLIVVREKHTHNSHQQIEVAIIIEIVGLHMSRRNQFVSQNPFGEYAKRVLSNP